MRELEETIVAARRPRAEHMGDYAAELTKAASGPVADAAQEILAALPKLRAAISTINEAALLCAPAYVAEIGPAPMFGRMAHIDLRGLRRLEDFAVDLVRENAPAAGGGRATITICGYCIPWDKPGETEIGTETAAPSSISPPTAANAQRDDDVR